MQAQAAFQNLLRSRLAEAQSANPSYSLRAYARKLGVHVGALTYIVNGKRNVSRKFAERIADRLLLDPQTRAELLSLFPEKRRRRDIAKAPTPRYLELSAAQFRAAAEWEHMAALSLSRCDDYIGEAPWIARRLGLSLARCEAVIERLLELGLFEKNASGRVCRSARAFRTCDDVAEISIKKHHEETLLLAKKSLHRDQLGQRDFTSTTMAIDPKNLSLAKERIRRFTDEMADLLESGNRTEVYRLSTQLFALSTLKMDPV